MLKLVMVDDLASQKIAYDIYKSNDYYFSKTTEITPSIQDVIKDSLALPPDASESQKKYCLIKDDDRFVGVVDLIEDYPSVGTVYIGLFMIHTDYQGHGCGSTTIENLFTILRSGNFHKVRLSVIVENEIALHFWKKRNFFVIDEKEIKLSNTITKKGVVMEKTL